MLSDRKKSRRDDAEGDEGTMAVPPPLPQGEDGPPVVSVIGPDLSVTGDLSADGAIQINGSVKGDITCNTLTVGESGKIEGNVSVQSLRISGTIQGQVRAAEVVINKTAQMMGDVYHGSLTVEQGALLEGHCARLTADQAKGTKPSRAQSSETQLEKSDLEKPDKGGNGSVSPKTVEKRESVRANP